MKRVLLLLAFLSFTSSLNTHDLSTINPIFKKHGSEDAQPIFQQLGLEAQKLVGLSKPITIKKLSPDSPSYKKVNGCCINGHIFIKETKNPHHCRLTLIHEAVHAKQFNGKKFSVINKKKYKHVEEEACLESAHLGNCWICTCFSALGAYSCSDTSEQAKKHHTKGYPFRESYLKIITDQLKNKCCCDYHANTSPSLKSTLLNLLIKKPNQTAPTNNK